MASVAIVCVNGEPAAEVHSVDLDTFDVTVKHEGKSHKELLFKLECVLKKGGATISCKSKSDLGPDEAETTLTLNSPTVEQSPAILSAHLRNQANGMEVCPSHGGIAISRGDSRKAASAKPSESIEAGK